MTESRLRSGEGWWRREFCSADSSLMAHQGYGWLINVIELIFNIESSAKNPLGKLFIGKFPALLKWDTDLMSNPVIFSLLIML
jgi:hypothetical protein